MVNGLHTTKESCSRNHGENPRHTPKPPLHGQKIMVTVWWTTRSVIHYSFLRPGQIINAELYCYKIEEMYNKFVEIDLSLTNRHKPILLYDNVSPHVAQITLQKLNDSDYEILPHLL